MMFRAYNPSSASLTLGWMAYGIFRSGWITPCAFVMSAMMYSFSYCPTLVNTTFYSYIISYLIRKGRCCCRIGWHIYIRFKVQFGTCPWPNNGTYALYVTKNRSCSVSPLSFGQSSVMVPSGSNWCSPNAHKRVVVFSGLSYCISLSTFIGNTLASEPVSSLNRTLSPVRLSLLAIYVLYSWNVSCQLLSPQRGSCC